MPRFTCQEKGAVCRRAITQHSGRVAGTADRQTGLSALAGTRIYNKTVSWRSRE